MAINSMIYGYMVDEHDYADKAVIIEEGSIGDWVYVILEGRVKMRKKTKKGMVTLATFKEGDIFGELPLFDKRDRIRTETVVANGPVKIGILDTSRLDKELELLSPQLRGLMRTLVSRYRDSVKRISDIAVD
jgi:CRP-like cAMP-binding protein